ncbi:hypothetical protein [Hyphococcus sp.]|uniref:hypothetical protein n=1 Tax=Hyphococcus sp. TaxID=2038636 RepID=UPI002089E31B|nr:MAG: hypothetical protein DHS20C04_05490 [Marinicaulis sp.]
MAATAVIQNDIASTFSVRATRVFHRRNNQVYAIVGDNPASGLITDVWFDRFDSQDEFRAVLTHVRDKFQAGGYRYWLADLRFLASSFSESEDWLIREIMPAMFEAGLKREAVVLPDTAIKIEGADAFATGARALREIADGRVRGFTDITLAKRWLLDGVLPKA